MTWAFEDAPVSGSDKLVLLAMADRADSHGRDVFESTERLAYKASVSRSTAKRALDALESAGIIERGNQAAAEYIRQDRRPVVWNLCMNRRREDEPPPSIASHAGRHSGDVSAAGDSPYTPEPEKHHRESPPGEPSPRGVRLTPRDEGPDSPADFTGGQIERHGGSLVTPDTKTKTLRNYYVVTPGDESPGEALPLLGEDEPENDPPPDPSPKPPKKRKREPDPVVLAAQRLAGAYYEAVDGFANFPAVLGVARKALKAGESEQAVEAALSRLADSGRPVTTDTLRIEIRGMEPARPITSARSNAGRAFDLARELRARAAEPPAPRPALPPPPLEALA